MSDPIEMVTIGTCKDCDWREYCDDAEEWICANHDKIGEQAKAKYSGYDLDDCLTYSYDEGGVLYAGDNFGCVHWKAEH